MDAELVDYAAPYVLGLLFFNRMSGIAYHTIEKNGLLGKVNREFRTSLESAYRYNIQKNISYFKCVCDLTEALSRSRCRWATLKGGYLCWLYPDGCRTSNDIDLLVKPEDVTEVGSILSEAGFAQGSIKNGAFVPASRREIVESRMMRGETVPYIKAVGLPFMEYCEVDINFSLDYKDGDKQVVADMLEHSIIRLCGDVLIHTPDDADFFLHLCAHLYKEATTLPWIKMRRDMTLYKYCDIYMLLSRMSNNEFDRILKRAEALGLSKILGYAVLETAELFDIKNPYVCGKAYGILAEEPDFRLTVACPESRKYMHYQTRNAADRFFLESREADLAEVGA